MRIDQSLHSVQQRYLSSKMAEDPKTESAFSPQNSDSNDTDYQMTADMMIHDADDERTIEEEEMLESSEDFSNEVNSLQKEGEMPIEDLLALYGYGGEGEHQEVPLEEIRPEPLPPFPAGKSTSESVKNIQGVEKDEDSRSVSSEGSRLSAEQSTNSQEENGYDPFQNQRITRGIASLHAQYFEQEESTDDEYQPLPEEWRKDVAVGPEYQAMIPNGLQKYDNLDKMYENEDKLLWKPDAVDNRQLKKYLTVIFSSPEEDMGTPFRDDEQALYLLLQCGTAEEALRRREEQSKLSPVVSLWSEEECRNFEFGLRIYGKDFRQIQRNKIPHRRVGEIVQFYYLWKKTERYDAFCTQTRFGKKKYGAPGIADYMDRFMDEAESVVSSRSASPYSHTGNIGNSSPAEVTSDKPITSSNHQITQSKSTYQNLVGGRPVVTSAPKTNNHSSSTAYHRVSNEPIMSNTHTQLHCSNQQGLSSSDSQGYAPASFPQIPTEVGSVKGSDLNLFAAAVNTSPYSAPSYSASNVAVFHIPSHLATARPTGVIHANDGIGAMGVHSLASANHHSWSSGTSMPLLDAELFSNAKHNVFNASQNAVNQRTVTFAGGGFSAGPIGQSLE